MTKPYTEKRTFYEGVLDFDEFAKNYILKCYKPSKDMALFVEHYFISRRRAQYDPDYIGQDVLSQPVATLFFTSSKSFVQGPSTGKRTLIAKTSPLYVGAQLKPGGFYPFWKKRISELAERTIPVTEVLPDAGEEFVERLLAMDDQKILEHIEDALRARRPAAYPHLKVVDKVIHYIEAHSASASVSSVASHFGMSERSLQHLFQVYVGVGAKWAVMRARFLAVIKYARAQEKLDWVVVAAEFGYSDQAHFINDFKKTVGQSPGQYLETISSRNSSAGSEKSSAV